MKRNTCCTIAIAAAVLLLAGTLASAGEIVDISQNQGERDGGPRGMSAHTNLGDLATLLLSAGIIDFDQNDAGNRGGGRYREPDNPQHKFPPADDDKSGRYIGTICLVNPVAGQLVCWSE